MFLNKFLLKSKDLKIKKFLDELKPNSKIMFVFDKGLGDLITFMDLFVYVQKLYPHMEFFIGRDNKQDKDDLISNVIFIPSIIDKEKGRQLNSDYIDKKYNFNNIKKEFNLDLIINLKYPEPCHSLVWNGHLKHEWCGITEFGFNPPIPQEFKFVDTPVEFDKTNLICMHFVTNTGTKTKSPNIEQIKTLYKTVKEIGYDIKIINNNFAYIRDDAKLYRNEIIKTIPKEDQIVDDISRKELFNIIKNTKIFLGVISGPLHIAQKLLGDDRCVFLNTPKVYLTIQQVSGGNMGTINLYKKEEIQKIINTIEKTKKGK